MSLFPTTLWTLVGRAVGNEAEAREALESLIRQYQRPLLVLFTAMARDAQMPSDTASDVLQEFLTKRIVEKHLIEKADQNRGRLRDLLGTAARNYFRDYLRREQFGRRLVDTEVPEPSSNAGTDAFDRAWAVEVLQAAIVRFRVSCDSDSRTDLWEVFRSRVLITILQDEDEIPYEQLIPRLGVDSATQAYNLLITAKRRFVDSLRAVVAHYAVDANEIDDELVELRRVLRTSRQIVETLSQLFSA